MSKMTAQRLAQKMNSVADRRGWEEEPAGVEDRLAEDFRGYMAYQYPELIDRITWNSRYIFRDGQKMRNPDYGFTWVDHRKRI